MHSDSSPARQGAACKWRSCQKHEVRFRPGADIPSEYQAIREHFGRFDLVMLEAGAFHPAWGDIHLGPERALEALALLGGGPFLPVHWGTFALAMHGWDQPPETLLSLAPRTGAHLLMPRLGEPVEPAHAEAPRPWWRAVDTIAHKPAAPTEESPITLADSAAWPLD